MPVPAGPPVVGAATDLLTIVEARQAIGKSVSDDSEDDALVPLVGAVSQALDDLCGPIVIRTVTESYDGGGSTLILNSAPVVSVTSVGVDLYGTVTAYVPYSGAPTSPYAYKLRAASGLLRLSFGCWPRGYDNVTVAYTAGRFVDTASVSAKFKQAASYFLRHMFMRGAQSSGGNYDDTIPDDTTGVPGFGVPNVVRDLLALEIRTSAVA